MRLPRLIFVAATWFSLQSTDSAIAAPPKSSLEQSSAFEFQDTAPAAGGMPDFASRGFKVIYRSAGGEEIPKADFERQLKGQEISMRVDGEHKIVEITVGGELPAELKIPLRIAAGEALPILTLVDMAGTKHGWPRADGKFTLLNFYFSGCGPCIQEIPELNELAAQREDLALLAVTFDPKDETRRFIEQRKLRWDIVPDARELIDALGVTVYPSFVLVDPAGKLVATRDVVPNKGLGAHESLDRWVSRALASVRN